MVYPADSAYFLVCLAGGRIDGFVLSCYIKKVPRVQFSLPVVSCEQLLPEDLDPLAGHASLKWFALPSHGRVCEPGERNGVPPFRLGATVVSQPLIG